MQPAHKKVSGPFFHAAETLGYQKNGPDTFFLPRSELMRSLQRALWQLCIVHFSFCTLLGCSHVPNQWREDAPSADAKLESPSESDIRANCEPAELRHRGWEAATVSAESGAVTHWPLYFEDPFEDKAHGRSDYRLGWED
jgi:hypothetical protein